jgi:quercetin dioxygenase-like cupin family protein
VHSDPVVRQSERKRMSIDGSNGLYELLSPDSSKKLEFLYITLKGRESSRMDLIAHEGEECGYVLKGHLLVKLGQKEYYLGEGDSMTFDSSIPHRYLNIDDVECVSVWAMTPPSF